ncbi:pyridoxal phosphate-dependent aminotransferase [Nitrosomonas sp. JL21]|uniref:aminotransferase class I/II-fold pyridoxal phosphate-dependent enzyme n=1 Tax=Nitrosomonas sp. JL21 TaxID=153949 RepID=UPI001371C5B4|nr:pyridoxal phosphate-dependent aminotransferase [Nitrosomonas sp.]MCC7092148.1 pyridoxal phosphate-dependent aminotransferase [Nitrosomonas sp.]MXS77307.1 pyridoxal phosphate-dependent aminotransferase [Nitrosomonas sp. JL21]
MELSNRVQSIKPSPTLAVTARAAKLKAEGKDIIGLGAGEPDFDTPQHIKDAAIAAINKGLTKYTAVGGTPGLKNAIVAKFKRENNFDFEAKQILVSCGGKQSFFNLTLSLINPGDEVIIPAPYWVSYPDIVLIAEGKPVFIPSGIEQNFKISAEQLEAAITPKTKMFVINSPSNPSGGVYSMDELKALGAVLRKHPQILIATDDMYEHILLSDQKFCNIVNACPDLLPQTVVLNGVSKAYSMTGWRIGYCGGPAHIITAMENVQSQSTSNPSSISQAAAEVALNADQSCITPMVSAFKERNLFVTEQLNQIHGIRCLSSEGAFYAFADVRQAMDDLYKKNLIAAPNDIAFSEYLLESAGVAVVPGSAFGCEGYMRLSFATSMENLRQALDRIKRLLK